MEVRGELGSCVTIPCVVSVTQETITTRRLPPDPFLSPALHRGTCVCMCVFVYYIYSVQLVSQKSPLSTCTVARGPHGQNANRKMPKGRVKLSRGASTTLLGERLSALSFISLKPLAASVQANIGRVFPSLLCFQVLWAVGWAAVPTFTHRHHGRSLNLPRA